MADKLCEDFCEDHKAQQVCMARFKDDIKSESSKREALAVRMDTVEHNAHKRIDGIDHNFTTELRNSTDKITAELKSIEAGLRLMISGLKDETNAKFEALKDKIGTVKDETKEDYRREIENARKDRETKIAQVRDETIGELTKKVPFWAFYALLVIIIASIGGLYAWQWDINKSNQEWQKCVSADMNGSINRINEAVTSLSRVIVEESFNRKQNTENIKRYEQDINEKIKRLERDIDALKNHKKKDAS
uniref:Uncharacterized protein n=1 Tax=viral metagenome TaxID=1070528 RepID=A0A6M3IXL2_9ZZZZ